MMGAESAITTGREDENAADDRPLSLVPTGVTVLPTPSRGPTIHLKTLDDVRIEMAKVYRAMKGREIETQDGTRLVYVLSQIGKMIESGVIAQRVEALERALARRPRP